jgi:hypothetical protein
MRHQIHPQDFSSQFGGLFDRLCNLDAAALPAPARVDLRLDDLRRKRLQRTGF